MYFRLATPQKISLVHPKSQMKLGHSEYNHEFTEAPACFDFCGISHVKSGSMVSRKIYPPEMLTSISIPPVYLCSILLQLCVRLRVFLSEVPFLHESIVYILTS